MNVFFCSKVFLHYSDLYRTMLTRCFSFVSRAVAGMIEAGKAQLSIEEKEKITTIIDGLFSVLAFAFKAVYDKILETFELKHITGTMELHDFKQLMNVLETEEEFIEKHLKRYLNINAKDIFLE
jgi:hypothetical protein